MVTNPFTGADVAARYAVARPALHREAVALLAERRIKVERAVDIGCGTGMSTRALIAVAGFVVGVDISKDMLRRADTASGTDLVEASAERLPFADASFGLATFASAIHWFAPPGLREARRVLTDDGALFIYDVWFRAEMVDAPGFGDWLSRESEARYPPVPKHPRPDLAAIGFEPEWEEDLRLDISMSSGELVAYLMTHSERIAAVRRGQESEEEQRALLLEGVDRFYQSDERRDLGFGIKSEMFSCVPNAQGSSRTGRGRG
ncbi:MAG TPA: methyltransferase domain-containing protein [Actinomycetota bacterium]|nr:methyltransferase domain-containing protein [Actinomycetota bacterium]